MARFKDEEGMEWVVKVEYDHGEDLKRLGLNLSDDGESISRVILGNPMMVFPILRYLCEEQAQKAGLTEQDFYRRLRDDAFDRATSALLEAVVFFIHRRRAPAVMSRLPKLVEKVNAEAADAMGRELDRLMNETYSPSAVGSPGSAAPAPEG